MGGDKENRRKMLCFVGGNLQGEPTKQASLRSILLAGREEAKPLGLPVSDLKVAVHTASKPRKGLTPDGHDHLGRGSLEPGPKDALTLSFGYLWIGLQLSIRQICINEYLRVYLRV